MVSVARRNLFHERARLTLSVLGVGFSILLIAVLSATYAGFERTAGIYIDHLGGDVVIMQEGAQELFHSFSVLPANVSAQVQQVNGVASADGVLTRRVEVHGGDGDFVIAVVGFESAGGPWRVAQGTARPGASGIVLDRVAAAREGLGVGDDLHLLGRTFRVVGLSEETNVFTLQYAFVDRAEAEGLLLPPDTVSFVLARVAAGEDPAAVRDRINAEVAGVTAMTLAEFRENSTRVILDAFDPILAVLYATGFLVGIMVVGQILYAATLEKMREYAILRALGASGRRVAGIVVQQALLASVLGFAVGVGLSAALGAVVYEFVPAMPLSFQPVSFLWLLLAAVGMSLIASLAPLRRVLRVDPATVFRR